jgi:hypothetical protein
MNPAKNPAKEVDQQQAEVLRILGKLKADDAKDAEKKKRAQNRSTINGIVGELEVPKGHNRFQNAWLTLTLTYELRFLDSRLRTGKFANNSTKGDVIVKHKELGFCARDLDDFLFPILDWDSASKQKFTRLFEQGEAIWNHQFLLIPPAGFDRLDYPSPACPGYVMRPNIICLFRMVAGEANAKTFNVVRINPEVFDDPTYRVPNHGTTDTHTVKDTKPARWGFRSHEEVLADDDVHHATLGHELGHALNEEHIVALKGDAQCKISPNREVCYGRTPEERANIMGQGKKITADNAKPWLDHLEKITGVERIQCSIVLSTDPKVQALIPTRIPTANKYAAKGSCA